MTELLDHLLTRRSIPAIKLAAPAPSASQLREMLTIATRVPDHGKLAPWRFILFQGAACEKIGTRLAALWRARDPQVDDKRLHLERSRFCRAPLVIGVLSCAQAHPKIPQWEQQLSAGAVCMNLMHAATAHGYASQWITEWFAYDDDAAALLGARQGERFAGFIHIGSPTEPPLERARPDVDKLLTVWDEA
jgi:nitroreductase